MEKVKTFPSLRKVFLNLVLFRLFLPLMVVELIAIMGVGYLGKRNLVNRQNQVAQSVSQIVDYHLDHGERILDAVAIVAETSEADNLSVVIKSTWEAYGQFDTLYYLDENNKIKLMMPSNVRYAGLEMSNIPKFNKKEKKKSIIISRPFISLRTGEPTVYLVRYLSHGGCMVGELNLGLMQKEITETTNRSGRDFVFIMDQNGTLLAHPSLDLVKEQTNLSNLGIFHSILAGKSNDFYLYGEGLVLGSAVRVERTGWVVVDQTPLSVFGSSYAWTVGLTFLASMLIWLTLNWNLRKQLQRNVITPIEQLSIGTNALIVGDFSKVNFLSSIPSAFSELNKLSADFQSMSNNLQAREIALMESENRRRHTENMINAQQDLVLKAEKNQREALEKALIMKDEFISLISHELKTPLNVIYSAIQLIECVYINQIPGRVKELVGNIKQNTLRQLRLADNLLDVTRLNSGQFKLKMINIDIVFLTKLITQSVKPYANQKNIKLSFKSNVESKTISIDDEKYERIILNLFSNAIKFTEYGGTISVFFNENKESNFVQIKIIDTGIGIPKDKQELIFERFGQVDNNLSRQAEGTGIGLSLVKLLVNILGGTIELESELGVGSTFSIMLPNKEEVEESGFDACLDIGDRLVSEIKVQFSDIYF